MSKSPRSIAVIGLGSFGASIASELAAFDDHVLGIDNSEARVSAMSRSLSGAVIADGRDERAMEEAGLASYDAVVIAIATSIECSVLAVMVAQGLEVPTIWAKANTDTHAQILHRLGVDHVLQPEREYGTHIAHRLHNPAVRSYVKMGDDMHMAQIEMSEQHDGKSLASLKIDRTEQLECLGLIRDNKPVSGEELTLQTGDALLVMGTHATLRELSDAL